MKYKVTLNDKVYEVEVEAGKAVLLDEYEACAPAPAAAPAAEALTLDGEGMDSADGIDYSRTAGAMEFEFRAYYADDRKPVVVTNYVTSCRSFLFAQTVRAVCHHNGRNP